MENQLNQFVLLQLQVLTKQARLISDLKRRVEALEQKSAPTAREQKTTSTTEETSSGMAEMLREMFGDNVTETTREGVKVFQIRKKDTCDCFVCRTRKALEQEEEQEKEQKEEQEEEQVDKGKTQE